MIIKEDAMGQFVGLDVSLHETAVCAVDADDGHVIWRGSCGSTPEAIAATVGEHAPTVVRLGLETGTLSPWLARGLEALGLPVVCLDARQAKAVLSLRINKSDANDAHGLAELVRSGWYRQIQVKSQAAYQLQALVGARAQLVKIKVDLMNQMRGLLRTFGLVVGKGGGGKFDERVRELIAEDGALRTPIEALLCSWRQVCEQIGVLDRRLVAVAKRSATIRRLMTVPGIGVVAATAYAAMIDDPSRFARSASVGAYVGLTPRRHQTGELDYTGRISKRGDPLVRSYLYEAAGVVLHRMRRPSWLKSWGRKLVNRLGFKKTAVAVARKLAVILHRIWIDGSRFAWSREQATV